MSVPPRILRRLVLAPLAFALSIALVAISPALFVASAAVDVIVSRRRFPTTRMLAFAVVYLVYEVLGLAALFGLWIAAGCGWRMRTPRIQSAHYDFMRWWLRGLSTATRVLLGIKIWIEDRPERRAGPILVLSRHAGPGNSLMLVGTIMIRYQRNPRIVMLEKLQWEPLFDVMLNRLPNRFVRPGTADRQHYLDAIRDLATGLGDRDAVVLFPEGRDFTPRLRQQAIERFRQKGLDREADQAEAMTTVLPPRAGGVIAAIEGAPGADVAFVAHTVLENLGSFGDVWRRIPLDRAIRSRYWRVPSAEVPRDLERVPDWLGDWWARIDRWIDGPHAADPVGAVANEP